MFFDILIILIIAVFVIWIVVSIIQEIKESLDKKEKAKQQQLDIEQRQEKRTKDRQIYYNNLNNVYDNLSKLKLESAYHLLESINDNSKQYREYFDNPKKKHTNIGIIEEKLAVDKGKFIKLINPNEMHLWKTSSDVMKNPLWYDLDLKYIENLLNIK